MVNNNTPLHPQKRPLHGVLRKNHHKNTIFIITLALLLCSLLFCGAAAADGETHTHDDITFQPWVDEQGQPITDHLPGTPGSYCLTADVTLNWTWTIPGGITNLCLNGHSVSLNTGKTGPVIDMGSGNTLNLYDCGTTGKITGGNTTQNGGGVYVYGGTFNMYGGSITGNTAQSMGGGVCVHLGGVFNMYGGSITNNTATDGGGVYVHKNNTFNMYGGSITNNTAERGGGVYSVGTFSMSGNAGIITGNSASIEGNGVYVFYGTFSVEGSASVMNNSSNNVLLSSAGKLMLTGNLTGTVLVTHDSEEPFGTASGTPSGANHIINEQNRKYAVITTGDDPGKLIWSESAFPGTLITLDWNNESGKQGKIAAFTNETTSFSITAPAKAKAGHEFTGWYLEQGGTTLLIDKDGKLASNVSPYTGTDGKWVYDGETLTLYAGWKRIGTELTLEGNGGTPPSQKVLVKTGSSKAESFITPVRPFYRFTGWYLEQDLPTLLINTDGTLVYSEATKDYVDSEEKWKYDQPMLSLYAGWEQTGTKLTLNGNGGTPGSQENIMINRESSKAESFTIPAKEGFRFTGWYLEPGGPTLLINKDRTLVYSDATKDYVDSNKKWIYTGQELTLYAGWKESKTSITYHDGTSETTEEISWGKTFDVLTPDPKTVDEFFGWVYIDTSGASKRFSLYDGTQPIYVSGSPYYDGEQQWISDAESLDLYALWAGSAVPGPTPSGNMTVSYQTGGGSYTLEIPSDLTLTRGVIKKASIKVTNVSVTEGYHVDVSLTSNDVASDDNSKFLLKLTGTNAGDAEYRIANSEDAFEIDAGGPSGLKGPFIKTGDKVLENVTEDKGVDLFFKLTTDPTTAGTYTGTITFTASVNPDAQSS